MRRTCQQSRRCYQQFFLPATSLARHPHLQQPRRRLLLPQQCRTYAREQSKRVDDLVVREYEQQGADIKTRVPINPQAELDEVKDFLKSKLDRLDKELDEMKGGPFGPNSEFMRSLPDEERQVALETMRKEGQTSQDDLGDLDIEGLDRLVKDDAAETEEAENDDRFGAELEPQVTLRPPKQHEAYVQAFNAAVKVLRLGPASEAKSVALWKSYQRCLQRIPNFLSLVPARAWDVLWQSQVELVDNANNIRALAEDMLAQSLPLSPHQLIEYTESLRSTGDLPAAVECWNGKRGVLGPNTEVARQFWALGIQVYSENDEPAEAQKIALECLDHGSFADATILVPVIAAWARAHTTKDNLQKAWTCYLRFKAELGPAIQPRDYESISSTLLKHNIPDMALAVFKDMLLDQVKSPQGYDSLSAFRKLGGQIDEMQSSAIDEQEVSKISLAALTILPRFLQNKYFFASWIKNLIGRGEVEAAAQVVELMYERGVRPDAKHLNGIVGAWLRQGRKGSAEKAEKLAWAMVNARVEFVRQRRWQRESNAVGHQRSSSSRESHRGGVVPLFVQRPVPVATIETFSILLLYYTRGCNDMAAQQLMDTMTNEAMIAPNSFIYNHWMYASLRAHDIQQVWNHYQNMRSNQVQPDLETFACLWDTAKLQFDRSKSAHYRHFPNARALFNEMRDWTRRLPRHRLSRLIHSEFSRDLYDQIIRVFALSHDLRGTLCALHGLGHLFDQYPDPVTSRIIVIQIGRLLPADAGHRPTGRRGSRRRIEGMRTAITAVNDILQIVTDQRALALMDRLGNDHGGGGDGDNGDDDPAPAASHPLDRLAADPVAAKQFRLDVLSDLLVVVLKKMMALSSSTNPPPISPSSSASAPGNNATGSSNTAATARLENEIRMTAKNMGLTGDGDQDVDIVPGIDLRGGMDQ